MPSADTTPVTESIVIPEMVGVSEKYLVPVPVPATCVNGTEDLGIVTVVYKVAPPEI